MASKLKFTTTAVDRLGLLPGKSNTVYWDAQSPGFGLRVAATGPKTYFCKGRPRGGGPERTIALGRHGDPVLTINGTPRSYPFGPDDARVKYAAVYAQLIAGVDPVAETRRKRAEAAAKAERHKALATTLRETLAHYLEHRRVKGRPLRPASKLNLRSTMEQHFAEWLDKPAAI